MLGQWFKAVNNLKRIEARLVRTVFLGKMGNACLHYDEDEEEVTQAGRLEHGKEMKSETWITLINVVS